LELAVLLAAGKVGFDPELFSQTVPMTGRFGFDPGAAWNALDVGFSPDKQQMPVETSPATELLAAVGLQRFRPLVSEDNESFVYATWGHSLPPSVGCAAASSLATAAPSVAFRGKILARAKYSAFSFSKPLSGRYTDGRE
jgi:CRISPR-associated protein Csx14